MGRLAVFDIDGTLTDTNAVDGDCFLRAVGEVLDVDPGPLDWSDAPHVTDSSIVRWICDECCGRPLREAEAAAIRERFLELLRAEFGANPARFGPVAGAVAALDHLVEAGWDVALATGGWRASARFKLEAAGFHPDAFVLASASDARTRPAILKLAVRRAARIRGDAAFSQIVSIGDGEWDARAAAALEWPFVGIARGRRAEALRAVGAQRILPDLADPDRLLAALDSAGVPFAAVPSRPSGITER